LVILVLLNHLCFAVAGQPNFGAIEIDWNAVPLRIKLELKDVEGRSVHSVEFPISELQFSDGHAIKRQPHTFQRHCTLETELPWLTRHRLALMLFVTIAGMLLTSISIIPTIYINLHYKFITPLNSLVDVLCWTFGYLPNSPIFFPAVFVVAVVLLAVTCLSNFTKSSKKSKKE